MKILGSYWTALSIGLLQHPSKINYSARYGKIKILSFSTEKHKNP